MTESWLSLPSACEINERGPLKLDLKSNAAATARLLDDAMVFDRAIIPLRATPTKPSESLSHSQSETKLASLDGPERPAMREGLGARRLPRPKRLSNRERPADGGLTGRGRPP